MVPGGEAGEARGPSRDGRAGEILRKNRAGGEGTGGEKRETDGD